MTTKLTKPTITKNNKDNIEKDEELEDFFCSFFWNSIAL